MKEGDGSGWNEEKILLPRHETYWREPAVWDALTHAGWRVLSCEHVTGRKGPWLFVLAKVADNS